MKNIMLIIKGFVFGIANIIPGVSGGTIALTMGVYEDLIASISHFFESPKKSIKFLLPFIVGAGLSILLISKLISYCLKAYPFATILFFVGLILGGIPLLTNKVRKQKIKPLYIILFILTFSLIIGMNFLNEGSKAVDLLNPTFLTYIVLFLVGIVGAATMVIPGLSGSFVLMLLGFYEPIVNTISNLTNFSILGHNLSILIPFGLGVLIGIILISKLIEYLFNKFELPTYYAILGFVIASVIVLASSLLGIYIKTVELVVGLVLFVLATMIGYKLGDE